MATVTIRDIDDRLEARLRTMAVQSGRSIEDEARDILPAALSDVPEPRMSLYEVIHARIEPFGGVELELPPREAIRTPPDFGS